ncbi:GH1 family beta-glucosidase [Dactylosporangium sp. CA-139066]|uniref:GH1 family beta-glucosidase n=1 Tax=Dactylosporangium sp. CA-139066 TaxID=3239930 RepID=UPI003D8A323A
MNEPLPGDFVLGVASSAAQTEGALYRGGRTASIWDTFSRRPGHILGADTTEIACEHYELYRQDATLMAELGIGAFRTSVSWSRVQPGGRGPVSPEGVGFYHRLVDALLERGIEPWLTLYHWDLPQELEDHGGWPVRDTAARFADYALMVHDALGDRVRSWITVNEPWCAAMLGYAAGEHAPGRLEPASALAAAHHLLLGHGLAAGALRARGARVGLALDLHPVHALSASAADADAARRIDGLANRLFLDPVLLGRYPGDVIEDLRATTDFGFVRASDLSRIAGPVDFLGVNYYTGHVVHAGPRRPVTRPGSPWPGSEHVRFADRGLPRTAMGWEIDPSGLLTVLRRLVGQYGHVPLYITENGAAFNDEPGPDGSVQDRDRIAYLRAHLRACSAAVREQIPLRGYFAWSFLDNFEWAWGYRRRFGLVYVDHADGRRRVPKASAAWYAAVIRSRTV